MVNTDEAYRYRMQLGPYKLENLCPTYIVAEG